MRNTIHKHQFLFRDGASKQNDTADRLDASYVQIENRSIEELIQEAQLLAKELIFVDKNNQATTTWESFLIEDPSTYYKESEIERASLRKKWASQLVAYVENPDHFLKDQNAREKASAPHTVLFLTFLELLHHIKDQINGLTQKHLDFYYRDRLGLSPKEAVQDMVTILIDLAEENTQLELKKGTVFLAGEDEEGNELHYTTTEDTIINRAQIEQIKNVFVDKQTFTIKKSHLLNIETPDKGVVAMMQMALGTPNPGDALPDFPEEFDTISQIFESLDQNEVAKRYVTEELFLSIEEFQLIFQKQEKERSGVATEWEPVYALLEEAFRRKKRFIRRRHLEDLHKQQGFQLLLREVYGDPLPTDSLPNYRGSEATFERVFQDLKNEDLSTQREASEFIQEILKLKVPDFAFMVDTLSKDITDNAWQEVYTLLENSERQVRRIIINPPTQEKILDIYAAKDATKNSFSQYNDKAESKRFKTFGNAGNGTIDTLESANLGLAITSPLLLLKEGQRTITLFQQLDIDQEGFTKLKKLFDKGVMRVYLSSEDHWFAPKNVTVELGDFLKSPSGISLSSVSIEEDVLTINDETGDLFEILRKEKIVVDVDGTIYQILSEIVDKSMALRKIGTLEEASASVTLYESSQVFVNAIKTNIELLPEEQMVTGIETEDDSQFIEAGTPSLVMVVNPEVVKQFNEQGTVSVFDCLVDLVIQKIGLTVEVTGLQNIIIQNDQSTLNPKKPFEPFKTEPEISDGLYFTNEEIAQKAITNLSIHPEWLNQPNDFALHYENYWKVAQNTLTPEENDIKIKSNLDFTTDVYLYHNFNELPVKEAVPLFPEETQIQINNIPALLQQTRPGYEYQNMVLEDIDQREVTDWQRYFKLELNGVDFQHGLYSDLIIKQAITTIDEIKQLQLPKPYQPKLKSLKISYRAETDMILEDGSYSDNQKVFHIHPFGYHEQQVDQPISFLPEYKDNGSLLLGISNCRPPQIITILFQLAEGTSNADINKPEVLWSYLKDNQWVPVDPTTIISDTTNGLLNSGIVRIRVPEDATTGGTLLSNQLHWFKIDVANDIEGIADTIAIKTQAIQVRLASEQVAASHFATPLREESITETQEFIPQIKSVSQPFTSSQGKPREDILSFNQRISQRLRHKNRALTMWDYEHLVLDAFPEVYKVKCLPAVHELGKVTVTVVPDIRRSVPFHPFGPKVASNTLDKIQKFLQDRAPNTAEISVGNPVYLQVLTRCTIKFNTGLDVIFYREKVIEEIKRFLSPWAFDDTQDIHLGGALDAGVLVNFIAERPYVDFVANLKLFQSIDGENFTDVTSLSHKKNAVIPDQPNMIMVSAANHIIDIADENNYDEDAEKGINYMIVETDFEVAKDF
ncbi:baseplate J/gp47 family protein [Aquimarina rubra]|uniref:Baseplate J/gp47 family protein n=1 Tax=Aquimarina rubra TaxID=1920033 RepID=A0ABW5LFV3_9FLAO